MPELDLDAARREGLHIITCPNDGKVLGIEERDGGSVRVNVNTRAPPVRGRVALTCDCGYRKDWKPSKTAGNRGLSKRA